MPVDTIFIIGIVGNVTSFAVYASPIPTFSIICRKKSTEMFSVVPYVFTLLTALLGLYYGSIKSGGGMLIMTVNGIGCIFELSYIIMFHRYASKNTKRKIWKLMLLEVLFFTCLVLVTLFATQGKLRIIVTGSISSAIAIAMYASPLSVMRTVIRTKNVEAMPLTLTIFLLINGLVWSAFAFFAKDIFIGIPSIGGSLCAVGQLVLYIVCRVQRHNQRERENNKPQQFDVSDDPKQHIIEMNNDEAAVNGHVKASPPKLQASINGTAFRTASGKILELLKEMPNGGIAVYRTASGKLLKEAPRYVELTKH